MNFKILQIKLALDMVLIALVLFNPEVATSTKIFVALIGFDYTMLSSKRIDELENKEDKNV